MVFNSDRFADKLIPALAWTLALVVTGLVAVNLLGMLGERPAGNALQAQQSSPDLAAGAIAGRHLMGEAVGDAAIPGAAESRFTLHAVVTAAPGHPGWAVLAVDGGSQSSYLEGAEILPGTRLLAVSANHVVIESGGTRRELPLSDAAQDSPSGLSAATADAGQAVIIPGAINDTSR